MALAGYECHQLKLQYQVWLKYAVHKLVLHYCHETPLGVYFMYFRGGHLLLKQLLLIIK